MKWDILHTSSLNQDITPDKIVRILLQNRGITGTQATKEFLHPSLTHLEKDFFDAHELDKAYARIKQAIAKKELIIVYSDYDVDGITGSAILWESLRGLGAQTLPFVPHRANHGYGLNPKGIDTLLSEQSQTKLIITVDNGATAHSGVSYARERGIDVIVTDHHAKPDNATTAYSTIHTTKLSGSGVALVFSSLLTKFLRKKSTLRFDREHLALAAMGTIADLVPLLGANRVIVKHGLSALNTSKRLGIRALIEEVGIQEREIGTYEVGFMLAPRINASGRLGHALDALRLLCTKDQARAWTLATQLDNLNTKRKELMQQAIDHARDTVEGDKKLLLIGDESYHEGVIGLVAGGLVDAFYRPAVVLSRGKHVSKASARSVRGFNIIEALRECSDLLTSVGGHPMAAGFTIETKKVALLEKRLQEVVGRSLTDDILTKTRTVDIVLPVSRLDWNVYESVSKLSPFGVGNKEPVFASRVVVVDAAIVGREGSHLKLKIRNPGGYKTTVFEAIGFGKGDLYEQLAKARTIDLAYTLSRNEWNGRVSLQLIIRDIKI